MTGSSTPPEATFAGLSTAIDDDDDEVTAVEADPASAANAANATPRGRVSRREAGEMDGSIVIVPPFGRVGPTSNVGSASRQPASR
jgi:hypothetical protein